MLEQHELEDKLEEGGVCARLILEVLGKPVEHVEETIKLLLGRLKEEEGISVTEVKLADTAEVEEQKGMYSSFAEIELIADDMKRLVGLCFFYMPSSVEIVSPAVRNMPCAQFTDLFNDLLAKLHNVDMIAKNLRAENEQHKINMGRLLRSSVLAITRQKKQCKDVADLLMIPEDQAEKLLNHLVEEGLLKKVGEILRTKPLKKRGR